MINKLPGSAGNYTNITDARTALESLPFFVLNDYGVRVTPTGLTVNIFEYGSDVVMLASGGFNITDLTLISNNQPSGPGGGINNNDAQLK